MQPTSSDPSLGAAGADETEADPSQRVTTYPAIVDTQLHGSYGDAMQQRLDTPTDVRRLWGQVNDPTLEPLKRAKASADLRAHLTTLSRLLAAKARDEGRTWSEIGDALEITRQAAQQRFS